RKCHSLAQCTSLCACSSYRPLFLRCAYNAQALVPWPSLGLVCRIPWQNDRPLALLTVLVLLLVLQIPWPTVRHPGRLPLPSHKIPCPVPPRYPMPLVPYPINHPSRDWCSHATCRAALCPVEEQTAGPHRPRSMLPSERRTIPSHPRFPHHNDSDCACSRPPSGSKIK